MARYTRNRVRCSISKSWFEAFVSRASTRVSTSEKKRERKRWRRTRRKKKCGKLSECFAFARTAYRIRVKVWLFYQRWKRSNQVCSLVVNFRDADPRKEERKFISDVDSKKNNFVARCRTMVGTIWAWTNGSLPRDSFSFSFFFFTVIFDVNRFPLG